jgi:hypothetical protein
MGLVRKKCNHVIVDIMPRSFYCPLLHSLVPLNYNLVILLLAFVMENFCEIARKTSSKCIGRISIRLNWKPLVRNHVTHINQFTNRNGRKCPKWIYYSFEFWLWNLNKYQFVSEECWRRNYNIFDWIYRIVFWRIIWM